MILNRKKCCILHALVVLVAVNSFITTLSSCHLPSRTYMSNLQQLLKPLHFSLNSGEGYRLTHLVESDTESLYRLTMQEKNRLCKTLPWLSGIYSINDTRKYIMESNVLMQNDQAIRMSVQAEQSNFTIIGVLSIDCIHTEKPRIGYWLAETYEGKGIMTIALSKLMEALFNQNKYIKYLYLYVASDNHKSKNIAKRLHFNYLERLHKSENLYGKWVDQDVFRHKNPNYLDTF